MGVGLRDREGISLSPIAVKAQSAYQRSLERASGHLGVDKVGREGQVDRTALRSRIG